MATCYSTLCPLTALSVSLHHGTTYARTHVLLRMRRLRKESPIMLAPTLWSPPKDSHVAPASEGGRSEMLATLVRGAEPRFHAWQIPRACPKVRYGRGLMRVRPSGRWAAVPSLGPLTCSICPTSARGSSRLAILHRTSPTH